jgi:hypothetical protein
MFNKKSRLNYRLKDKEIYSLISKSSIFLLLMVHAKKMEIKIMFCSVKIETDWKLLLIGVKNVFI